MNCAFITVAPVTTRVRCIPSEVPLSPADGAPKACVINLDTLTTNPKSALGNPIALLSVEKLRAVHAALRFALDLP